MPVRTVVGGDATGARDLGGVDLAKVHRDRLLPAACTRSIRSTASTATRATRRRSTWRRCASTAPAGTTGAASRRSARSWTACSELPWPKVTYDHFARQPAAGRGCESSRGDPAAYRKLGVRPARRRASLRGVAARGGRRCCRRSSARAAWDEPRLRRWPRRRADGRGRRAATLAELELARLAGADRLSRAGAGAPTVGARRAERRPRPASGRRQRRQRSCAAPRPSASPR